MGDGVFNAVIREWSLFVEFGQLHLTVEVDYGGSGQAFGCYVTCVPGRSDDTGRFLLGLMGVAGVDRMGDLSGRPVRVRRDNRLIVAVGHFLNDVWFCPKEVFGDKTEVM